MSFWSLAYRFPRPFWYVAAVLYAEALWVMYR